LGLPAAPLEAGVQSVREVAAGGAGTSGLGRGAILAGQQVADGPDPVLAVQEGALAGGVGRRGRGLLARERAGGRERGRGVDAVDRGAPAQGALLRRGADELLLDADVGGVLLRLLERTAALPAADQP